HTTPAIITKLTCFSSDPPDDCIFVGLIGAVVGIVVGAITAIGVSKLRKGNCNY
ncbi:hypothetical protein DPMN_139389, partial [Dreissena polymorpha]